VRFVYISLQFTLLFHSQPHQDKGQLVGIRTPNSNNPIQNVNDANFACNSGFRTPVSTTVIDVNAGDKVGVQWGHVIGGAQFANDKDHPIAASHKGIAFVPIARVHKC
jgi:cellulase